MTLRKKIAILAIVTATGLFAAADMNSVSALVDKINSAKDSQTKTELMEKLHAKLAAMDKKDLSIAQELVNKKLKVESTK
jgi:hypothetical protein